MGRHHKVGDIVVFFDIPCRENMCYGVFTVTKPFNTRPDREENCDELERDDTSSEFEATHSDKDGCIVQKMETLGMIVVYRDRDGSIFLTTLSGFCSKFKLIFTATHRTLAGISVRVVKEFKCPLTDRKMGVYYYKDDDTYWVRAMCGLKRIQP